MLWLSNCWYSVFNSKGMHDEISYSFELFQFHPFSMLEHEYANNIVETNTFLTIRIVLLIVVVAEIAATWKLHGRSMVMWKSGVWIQNRWVILIGWGHWLLIIVDSIRGWRMILRHFGVSSIIHKTKKITNKLGQFRQFHKTNALWKLGSFVFRKCFNKIVNVPL